MKNGERIVKWGTLSEHDISRESTTTKVGMPPVSGWSVELFECVNLTLSQSNYSKNYSILAHVRCSFRDTKTRNKIVDR